MSVESPRYQNRRGGVLVFPTKWSVWRSEACTVQKQVEIALMSSVSHVFTNQFRLDDRLLCGQPPFILPINSLKTKNKQKKQRIIALKCRYLCLETIHIFVCQRVKRPVLDAVVWPGLWLIFLYDLMRLVLFVALPGRAPETRKENNKCIGQRLSGRGIFCRLRLRLCSLTRN